jgi:hypothetical protein
MKASGEMADNLIVEARTALLDALEALREQCNAVVVVGAQAVYLRSGSAVVAIAESTKDSDLVLDPRLIGEDPLIEEAMQQAGFVLNVESNQPGAWLTANGIPVDLMIPETLSQPGGQRGGRIPPHSKTSTRRAVGLEACVVDHDVREIPALDPADGRRFKVRVAGSAALIVAKIHKLHERLDQPNRLNDKDAHDVYRLLVTIEMAETAAIFERLLADPVSAHVTKQALEWMQSMFAEGPAAIGSMMAGRTEEGVGEPDVVAASTAILAAELLVHMSISD